MKSNRLKGLPRSACEADKQLRTETHCRACGGAKDIGCVVCWGCFKYPHDIGWGPEFTPLKYSPLDTDDWLRELDASGLQPQPFALANDPPAHKPQQFDNGDATRQRVLIDGCKCLPGQLNLF